MRTAALLLVSLALLGCRDAAPAPESTTAAAPAASTTTTATATAPDNTVAEKAFDAGMRGKQKAQQIQADQAQRAQETDSAGLE